MSTPRAARSAARATLRALRLPRDEQRAAAAALLALLVAVRGLSRGGLAAAERDLAWLPRLLPRQSTTTPTRLAVLVGAVAKHVPRAQCLARSLALARLVGEARGVDVALRIGVRPGEDALAAHAWVELGGVVLNDTDDVAVRFPIIETRTGF